jgi:hypothetical protein
VWHEIAKVPTSGHIRIWTQGLLPMQQAVANRVESGQDIGRCGGVHSIDQPHICCSMPFPAPSGAGHVSHISRRSTASGSVADPLGDTQ